MPSAKNIVLKPLDSRTANAAVKRWHYSGKVVNNSQLHIGVYLLGELGGVMQFGPSLDKRKVLGLVRDTRWDGCIELNRMAFSDWLPRNSESRALGVAMRLLRNHCPQVEWVISFADATQCGDGTIYRASGFVLTGIKVNNQLWAPPDGEGHAVFSRMSLTDTGGHREQAKAAALCRVYATKGRAIASRASMTMNGDNVACAQRRELEASGDLVQTGAASMKSLKARGWRPLPGFQLRYIYFLSDSARDRLTVPIIPFSEIERRGAAMYLGKPRPASSDSAAPSSQDGEGGAIPTAGLESGCQERVAT